MKKLRSLSIFFPSLNDSQVLPYLISRVYNAAAKAADKFEIIIINDGSTDNTGEIVTALRRQYPMLRLINHPRNLGYGMALRSGFRASRYDWVFYTDSDGQYDPYDLILLANKLTPTVDVVNGYKGSRSDTIIRTFAGNIYNAVTHLLYPLPIRDVDCDFRLIKRSILKEVLLVSTSGTICLELIRSLQKTGALFAEVKIHHYPRKFGKSEFFKPQRLKRTLIEFISYIKANNFLR